MEWILFIGIKRSPILGTPIPFFLLLWYRAFYRSISTETVTGTVGASCLAVHNILTMGGPFWGKDRFNWNLNY